nr:T9SS type A sorting domain-containing protein [Bacteroidota bacterium]
MFFILLLNVNAYSQGRNANWVFGDSAGIHFDGMNVPTTFHSTCVSDGESATISDTLGNLLFFVHGISLYSQPNTKIIDNNFIMMQNGDSIIGDNTYNSDIIIPVPLNDSLYYHISCVSTSSAVHYTVIRKNNFQTNGVVISKNNLLLSRTLSDCLNAVRHGNGRDWWIITRLGAIIPNDTFFVWLLEPNGISGPYKQHAGISKPDGIQRSTFNNDGSQFTEVSYSGKIEEFNFDRCTGTITSNRIIRNPFFGSYLTFWHVTYSSKGKYLYVSHYNINTDSSFIFQLDMDLQDPWLNRDTIWAITPWQGPFLKLGPDKRIYVAHADIKYSFPYYPYPSNYFTNKITHLGVINQPDSPAVSCDFQPYSFYLGPNARTYTGTSNLPDYNLGPLVGSGCDTLSLPNPSQGGALGTMSAYYHHDWQTIFVNAQNLKGQNVTISVYDGLGSLKLKVESLKAVGGYFTQNINATNWPAGLYLIELKTENEKIACKVVKY